ERPAEAPGEDIIRADPRRRGISPIRALIARVNLLRALEQTMWQAGVYLPVHEALLAMLALGVVGTIVGFALWGDLLFSLVLGAGAATMPLLYIRFRRQRRLKAFTRQLPYALDLIKSSLEAGHSLLRGFQVVVAEFADPIGGEFRSMLEQSRLGLPLARSLEEMLNRVPVEDLRLMVVAVRVQSEVGSSLAQIVGRLSEIVRTRQRLQQQIRALTAQSRLSGMIVGFLPIVLLGAFSVIQPEYTHTLFHDPIGIKILRIAVVLDAIAFVVIRKLIRVDF
ncbi:MAG TPA: type II secretion system F family protein, partial [Candidatus Binataceae bacterium]|nr:type II secretion system F family protein [Candidatus Binataceae bacterium]